MRISFGRVSSKQTSLTINLTEAAKFNLVRAANIRENKMIEEFGGTLNFIAVLIPTLMAFFYGFRCLFATEGFIAQYGLGAASEFMIKTTGTFVTAQGLTYAILILTSPAGAWSVFAFGTIQAALFLYFGYTTTTGKWAEVEGVKASKEGYIVPAILLVFHLIIMFNMSDVIYAPMTATG